MSEWKKYKLSEFIEINPKVTLKSGIQHSFVEMKDLNESQKYVFPSQFKDIKGGARFQNSDTLFARITPCLQNGKICQVQGLKNSLGFGSTEFLVFRGKDGISYTEFIYYLSRYEVVRKFAEQNMIGTSGRQRVSKDAFANLELYLPDLPTQTAIAEILSSIDDKIGLNNKINQELETLAKSIFKHWFIDFEFPNEKGEPYKSSGGEMVDSELGEIPKGWEVVKVSSLEYKLQTGTRPKGGVGGITNGIPSIGAESVKGLGYYDFSKIKYVSIEFASKMKRGKVEGYELLIYKDGGKPGTFIPHFTMFGEGFPFETFYINEHVFLLDFFDKNFNSFCYFFFDSLYVKPVFENNGGKAAIPGINQEDVKELCIFHPQNDLVKQFGEYSKSSITTILKNCKENESLRNLRDILLPKLISGELEINEISN